MYALVITCMTDKPFVYLYNSEAEAIEHLRDAFMDNVRNNIEEEVSSNMSYMLNPYGLRASRVELKSGGKTEWEVVSVTDCRN